MQLGWTPVSSCQHEWTRNRQAVHMVDTNNINGIESPSQEEARVRTRVRVRVSVGVGVS